MKLGGGEQVGDRQAERGDDHRRGETGDEAQPQRLQDERVPQPGDEVARWNAEHEAQQREAEQEDQQRAQRHSQGAERDAGGSPPPRRYGGETGQGCPAAAERSSARCSHSISWGSGLGE